MKLIYIDDAPTEKEEELIREVAQTLSSILGKTVEYVSVTPDGAGDDYLFFNLNGRPIKNKDDLPQGVSYKQLLKQKTVNDLANETDSLFLLDINFDEQGNAVGLQNYGLDIARYLCEARKVDSKRIYLFSSYPDHAKRQEQTLHGCAWFDVHDKNQLLGAPDAASRLAFRLYHAFELELSVDRRRDIEEVLASPDAAIGNSQIWKDVKELCVTAAPTNARVLLLGESGTGKEILANVIHARSRRSQQTFVRINCGAFPEDLLESELFGHERGAFTGAVAAKRGLFEVANEGTIFLDEIGEASPRIQVRLLRVIQEGEFIPLGSETVRHVNVRIIAATNSDLKEAISNKVFREDLYYRLSVIEVHLPPLRDRREDIPLLAYHFLQKYAREHEREGLRNISKDTMTKLEQYSWPGNVRELQNVIERAVIIERRNFIAVESLPQHLLDYPEILKIAKVPSEVEPPAAGESTDTASFPSEKINADEVKTRINGFDEAQINAAQVTDILNHAQTPVRSFAQWLAPTSTVKERRAMGEAIKQAVRQIYLHKEDPVNVFEDSKWIYAVAALVEQWLTDEEQVKLLSVATDGEAKENLDWQKFTGSQNTKNVKDWKSRAEKGETDYVERRDAFHKIVSELIEPLKPTPLHEITQTDFFYIIQDNYDESIELAIPLYRTMHEEIVRFAPQSNGEMKVLDLGCGTGKTSAVVLQRFPSSKVYAIDFFDEMLKHARARLAPFAERFTFTKGDFREVQFGADYDLCISALAIHHSTSDEKKNLFARIHAALKPNGRFVMIDWTKFDSPYMQEVSAQFAEENAGKDITDKTVVSDWVHHWREKNIPDTVEDMMQWLTDAGFSSAECVLRSYGMAMICAEK